MKYHLQEVEKFKLYKIFKRGKLVETFEGAYSYADAHRYIQECIEDDRLNSLDQD